MIRHAIIILIFRNEMIVNFIAIFIYNFEKFINAAYSLILIILNFELSFNAFSLKHIIMFFIQFNVLILKHIIYSLFFKC